MSGSTPRTRGAPTTRPCCAADDEEAIDFAYVAPTGPICPIKGRVAALRAELLREAKTDGWCVISLKNGTGSASSHVGP